MRRRILSIVLAVVLVLTGIPVVGTGTITAYAQDLYGDGTGSETGLFVTDCIDGGNFVPDENDNVTYSKQISADLSGSRLAFKYVSNGETEGTAVTADDISITTKDGGSAAGLASVVTCDDNGDFCDFTFHEVGDYVVTCNKEDMNVDNTVTIHVEYPVLGFYKANAQTAGNYLGEGFTYQSGTKTVVYVIPHLLQKSDYYWADMKSISYTIEGEYIDSDAYTVEPVAGTQNDDGTYSGVTKITFLKDGGGNFGIKATGTATYLDDNNEEQQEDGTREVYLNCEEDMTGLVFSQPDWSQGIGVPENPDSHKSEILPPMMTHWRAFFTKDSMGNDTLYTGSLTLLKVADNGTVTATSDGTIENYEVAGIYSVKFNADATGRYRIYNSSGSYVSIAITDIESGFYSSSEICNENLIETLTFSEKKNRSFYFSYIKHPGEDDTVTLATNSNSINTNGNPDAVTFEKVTGGDNTRETYKITLGDNFETAWTLGYDLNFTLQHTAEGREPDYPGISLEYQYTGLVYAWPEDVSQAPSADAFCKIGSCADCTEVFYFGIMDESGKVTPVRNIGSLTVDKGATIEAYDGGIPGYYEVTFPTREVDYTFTYQSGDTQTKARIFYEIPQIQFFKDNACSANKEILDGQFFVEDENSAFYVKVHGLEWDTYQYIIMKDEGASDTKDLYYGKDYTSGSYNLQITDPSPFTITVERGSDNDANSEKIYKVTLKNDASIPAQLGFSVKAEIHEDWIVEGTLQICRMTAKSDTTSTFKGGESNSDYVKIEEIPQPDDLFAGEKDGLTEAQQQAIKDGGELSVSIKADTIAVDSEGNVTPPESASEKEKNEIKTAVGEIKKTQEKKLSDKYQTEFLDLTVKTVVTPKDSQGDDKLEQPVTQTKEPLVIKIPLPTKLKGKGHYVVIRYHDGELDILTVTYDSESGYIIFETDRFSTYAIAYREPSEIDNLDFSNVKWNNTGEEAFEYDGTTKTCEAVLEGLPTGCTAVYSGKSATNNGNYVVKVASITYTNGNNTTEYKISELPGTGAKGLPKAVTDGYNWAIVPKSGGQGGGTGNNGNSGNNGNGGTGGSISGGGGIPSLPTNPTNPTDPTEPTGPAITVNEGDILTVDDSNYQVTDNTSGEETVAYAGGDKSAKKITIPSSIIIDGITYKVTAIAADAFSGCSKLTKVTIPDTVTKIGKSAFKDCVSLKRISIPKNVVTIGAKAFYNCEKLSKITFAGTKIKKIGKKAFAGIAKNSIIAVPENKKKAYTKLLKNAGYKKTVK